MSSKNPGWSERSDISNLITNRNLGNLGCKPSKEKIKDAIYSLNELPIELRGYLKINGKDPKHVSVNVKENNRYIGQVTVVYSTATSNCTPQPSSTPHSDTEDDSNEPPQFYLGKTTGLIDNMSLPSGQSLYSDSYILDKYFSKNPSLPRTLRSKIQVLRYETIPTIVLEIKPKSGVLIDNVNYYGSRELDCRDSRGQKINVRAPN